MPDAISPPKWDALAAALSTWKDGGSYAREIEDLAFREPHRLPANSSEAR
jgi:hypothetical protein